MIPPAAIDSPACIRFAKWFARTTGPWSRHLLTATSVVRCRVSRNCADVNAVLRGVARSAGSLLGPGIRLDMRLTDERALVRAGAGSVQDLVTALALNAREEMPAGGVLVIETAVHPEHSLVRITARDTGRGLRPDAMTDVAAFFVPTADAAPGMPLMLTARAARRLGGTFDVLREPFVGTTLTIDLPLATRR